MLSITLRDNHTPTLSGSPVPWVFEGLVAARKIPLGFKSPTNRESSPPVLSPWTAGLTEALEVPGEACCPLGWWVDGLVGLVSGEGREFAYAPDTSITED